MNQAWLEKPILLTFNLPGMRLFSLKFRGMVLEDPFAKMAAGSEPPTVPFGEFPAGIEAVWIPSHPLPNRLPRFSLQGEWIRYVPSQYQRRWIDLRSNFEEYVLGFSLKSRSTLRRKVRKYAQLCGGNIPWQTFRAPGEMEEFYREARRISTRTYQEKLWNAGLPGDEEFRCRMAAGAAKGEILGYMLYYGRKPIAYMYCRARGDFLLYEYVGYDPYFRAWSPGVVLLYLALEQLFREGRFQGFDFGPQDSTHKLFFSNRSTPCAEIYYFPRRLRHLAVLGIHSGLEGFSRAVYALLDLLGLRVLTRRFSRSDSNVFTTLKATVARVVRNPLLDLKYGAVLRGVKRSPFEHLGAVETANSDYAVLPQLFKNVVGPCDVLVDVGCGRGRVINWWLNQGWKNKLIGIELDPEVAEKTKARLKNYPNVVILAGDVNDKMPADGTVFYLYHPFHWPVMERFKNRLEEAFGERGGAVLVYYNCMCVDLFKSDPRWEVQELDLHHPGAHPAAIIRMKVPAGPTLSGVRPTPDATLAEHRK